MNLTKLTTAIIQVALVCLWGTPVPSFALDSPQLVVQQGHTGFVRSIALSPDGRYAITGSNDTTARLWDVESGLELRVLGGHKKEVEGVAYDPGGRTVATCSTDGTVKLWDVVTGEVLKELREAGVTPDHYSYYIRAVAFSSDGSLLAGAHGPKVIIWNLSTSQPTHVLVHQASVQAVAFSPNRKYLASGTWAGDNRVVIWNLDTGRRLYTLRGHKSGITSLSFSRDSALLASGSEDGTLRLWDLGFGGEVHRKTFRIENSQLAPDVDGAFSPDGRWLAVSALEDVQLCSVGSWNNCRTLKSEKGFVSALSFSGDSTVVAAAKSGAHNQFSFWKVPGRQLKYTRPQSVVNPLHSIAVSRDGRWLASAALVERPGQIELWELNTGLRVRTLVSNTNSIHSLTFSPAGPWLAAGSSVGKIKAIFQPGDQKGNVTFWDVVTGRNLGEIVGLPHVVNSLAFNASGSRLLTASGGDTIQLWDTHTFKQLWAYRPHVIAAPHLLNFVVGYNRGGHWLYAGGPAFPVYLWNARTGKKHQPFGDLGDSAVTAIAVSPDGRIGARNVATSEIELWDIDSSMPVSRLSGHNDRVSVLEFSPDGTYLVSGSTDGFIAIWQMPTGKLHRKLMGHQSRVVSLAVTPDGARLFSASSDGTTRLWDMASGKHLATLLNFESGDWLVATPDGLFDGTPDGWSQVLWRFSNSTFNVAPIEIFFNEFFRPGLLAEIMAGQIPRAPSNIADIDRRQPKLTLKIQDAVKLSAVSNRWVTLQLNISEAPPAAGRPHHSGVRDVRVLRNGSLVKRWRGDVLKGNTSTRLETRIPITAGNNHLTAYAFNSDNVKSRDAAIDVKGVSALKRPGTIRIVTVGIDRYLNPRDNLKYAVSDANAFASELRLRQQAVGRYDRIEVIPLLNEDATKKNFLGLLSRLAGRTPDGLVFASGSRLKIQKPSQPEDALVIFFAGHGDAAGERFYLIPHDFRYRSSVIERTAGGFEAALRSHGISDEEIETAVEGIYAGKFLLIIDACKSGQALEAEERRRGPMNSKGLAQLAYEKGMHIITAAQAYQFAVEPGQLKYGILTYALVEEGLKINAADRAPKDGELWMREWLDYAVERVPEIYLEMTGARDSLGRGVAPVTDPDALKRIKEILVQRPRVFYRREPETSPLVVMRRP